MLHATILSDDGACPLGRQINGSRLSPLKFGLLWLVDYATIIVMGKRTELRRRLRILRRRDFRRSPLLIGGTIGRSVLIQHPPQFNQSEELSGYSRT